MKGVDHREGKLPIGSRLDAGRLVSRGLDLGRNLVMGHRTVETSDDEQ
ncbi:MAG: hypothetical protein QW570_08900 [Candidatus Caldarchaeum sp.]